MRGSRFQVQRPVLSYTIPSHHGAKQMLRLSTTTITYVEHSAVCVWWWITSTADHKHCFVRRYAIGQPRVAHNILLVLSALHLPKGTLLRHQHKGTVLHHWHGGIPGTCQSHMTCQRRWAIDLHAKWVLLQSPTMPCGLTPQHQQTLRGSLVCHHLPGIYTVDKAASAVG
jgi:hypothetical protein